MSRPRGAVYSRRAWLGLVVLGAGGLGGCSRSEAASGEITVAAAASLRTVMPSIVQGYQAKHPTAKISVTYGASGDLRKQVEGGAPIDLVLFASARPVDDLIEKGLADADSRVVVAHNQLVLIGPKGGPAATFATLGDLPERERIAIGDPGPVPAGQYAKEALTALGVWESLQPRLVFGGDVGAVLTYARRGEVVAAIVYATEARGVDDIVVLERASGEWAPRPEVVAARVKVSASPGEATAFLAYLREPDAQAKLAEYGFAPP